MAVVRTTGASAFDHGRMIQMDSLGNRLFLRTCEISSAPKHDVCLAKVEDLWQDLEPKLMYLLLGSHREGSKNHPAFCFCWAHQLLHLGLFFGDPTVAKVA